MWFSVLQAVFDKSPLRVAHISMLRSRDRSRPKESQLGSIELPNMRSGLRCH